MGAGVLTCGTQVEDLLPLSARTQHALDEKNSPAQVAYLRIQFRAFGPSAPEEGNFMDSGGASVS